MSPTGLQTSKMNNQNVMGKKYKHALVTGGAGFVGSHIVDALLERGLEVTVVDNLSTGRRENIDPKADFFEMSILSPNLGDVIQEIEPDVVFHLAAQINARTSVEDPPMDAEANVLGTIRVAHKAAQSGAQKIIFTSTGGAMFGPEIEPPHTEDMPVSPKAPYGISKHSAEMYINFVGDFHDISTINIRPANIYGPRQDAAGEAGVVAIFSELMLEEKPVTIFGDGEQTRDYVYVADVVRAQMLAMENDVSGIFHVGTGQETSVNALYEMLSELTGNSLSPQRAPAKAGELRRSALDAGKAKEVLGWGAEVNLKQGLEKTVDWFRSELDV